MQITPEGQARADSSVKSAYGGMSSTFRGPQSRRRRDHRVSEAFLRWLLMILTQDAIP
jgi:hypothetical protein